MYDFSNNATATNNKPKPFESEDEFTKKLEQIKINKERKKQGLEPIKTAADENKPLIQEEKEEEAEKEIDIEPPKISEKKEVNKNSYSYLQSQMQGQLAFFQAEKLTQIAAAAKKESQIIYKFDESHKQPPKLGEKRNTKNNLIPIKVYYNEIPNDIHYELDALRAQVSDLQYVKSLQVPQVDHEGVVSPAILTKNDPEVTGLTNKQFSKLNEEINLLNKKIAAKMALWMYGIDEELIPNLEVNSLSNALEAGLYREMYGIVTTSKNSAVY